MFKPIEKPREFSADNFDWLVHRPIAHRGLHDEKAGIIENSISAVKAAIDLEYSIEVDLQISSDGEAMVFHDENLDRLTKEKGPVADRTAAELKSIGFLDTNDKMITLNELFELVGGKSTLLLELKSNWKDNRNLVERVGKCIAKYSGPTAVMSFDPQIVRQFFDQFTIIPRGIVAEQFKNVFYWNEATWMQRFVNRHMLHAFKSRPQFVAYDVNGVVSAAPLIAKHLFKVPLLTWTVRTDKNEKTARRYCDAMIFEGFLPDYLNR